MTSLLLLRRSLTRCFWQESNGNYLLFPSVLCSLVLRSLLVRRWRRRRLDPDFLRPSQGTRTPPGLPSPRPLASGFACPFLHPVTYLLHRPGCGQDGAPPLTRPWSMVLRLLCFAPFYPYCAIVQREQCRSHADAARSWDLLPGINPGDDQGVEGGVYGGHEKLLTNPGDDQGVEGGVYGGHEKLLEAVRRWRSTSANRGSLCYS